MKKHIILIVSIILFFLTVTSVTLIAKNHNPKKQYAQPSEKQNEEISRKDELQLEGFINDYFYRRNIKDPSYFGDFDAYGSVTLNSIVVYVYPKETLHKKRIDRIKIMIKDGLQSTLFDFPDLEWTKEYSFHVIFR